ncbi:hypothetical protein Chor_001947 [Crotalus horridus]
MAAPGAAPEAAAASSSFLGFSASSRDPSRLPSRRVGGRGARNRKKGWKRWRGPEAELGRELGDWLEERASELRHLGILSYQVPNGRKLKRKQRLWEKLSERGVVPRKERLLQQRLQNPPKAKIVGADSGTDPSRDFYDIWARPDRLKKTPSELPAVEVISPGGSYNPSFQSHQALLLQAFEAELVRQKAAERLQRQLNFPTAAEAPTQESVFQEQCEGLMEEESEGEEGQHRPQEEENLQAVSPLFTATAVGEKKTERQRKKEKADKQSKASQLVSCFSARPPSLPDRYEEPDVDVQLSSELAESLRTLRVSGSPAFGQTGTEEGSAQAVFKRKYRLKYVEKRAFREITL